MLILNGMHHLNTYKSIIAYTEYCRFGNVRENLIFANFGEFGASVPLEFKVLANIDLL